MDFVKSVSCKILKWLKSSSKYIGFSVFWDRIKIVKLLTIVNLFGNNGFCDLKMEKLQSQFMQTWNSKGNNTVKTHAVTTHSDAGVKVNYIFESLRGGSKFTPTGKNKDEDDGDSNT